MFVSLMPNDRAIWLKQAAQHGAAQADALAMFTRLPSVTLANMAGRWAGGGLHTGHWLDGLLEAYGWYGKAFDARGNAHPLLFHGRDNLIAINPCWLPIKSAGKSRIARSAIGPACFKLVRGLLQTQRPQARLSLVTHEGVTSAAMIYDRLPIIDMFRQVTPTTLLGLMDMKGEPPFFFSLRRDD